MKIYKRAEIEKMMTEEVNSYILQGYRLSTATMGGSQSGCLAFVDLTDGELIIRISLNREGFCDDCFRYTETLVMLIEIFDYDTTGVLWIGKGTELKKEVFVSMASGIGSDWETGAFTDLESWEAEKAEITEKRVERARRSDRASSYPTEHPISYDFELVKHALRNHYGFKHITPDKISFVTRRDAYSSTYSDYMVKYVVRTTTGKEVEIGGYQY